MILYPELIRKGKPKVKGVYDHFDGDSYRKEEVLKGGIFSMDIMELARQDSSLDQYGRKDLRIPSKKVYVSSINIKSQQNLNKVYLLFVFCLT